MTHHFTLILDGNLDIGDDVQDPLFEAGCDDALLGMQNGVTFLDFAREAESLDEAVRSAIDDVNRAGIGLQVVRVEPGDEPTARPASR